MTGSTPGEVHYARRAAGATSTRTRWRPSSSTRCSAGGSDRPSDSRDTTRDPSPRPQAEDTQVDQAQEGGRRPGLVRLAVPAPARLPAAVGLARPRVVDLVVPTSAVPDEVLEIDEGAVEEVGAPRDDSRVAEQAHDHRPAHRVVASRTVVRVPVGEVRPDVDQSPWDRHAKILADGAPAVWGYGWGTLLTPADLERIGGLEAVLSLPGAHVEDLPGGRVWVTLGNDPSTVPDGVMRALHEALRPALTQRSVVGRDGRCGPRAGRPGSRPARTGRRRRRIPAADRARSRGCGAAGGTRAYGRWLRVGLLLGLSWRPLSNLVVRRPRAPATAPPTRPARPAPGPSAARRRRPRRTPGPAPRRRSAARGSRRTAGARPAPRAA